MSRLARPSEENDFLWQHVAILRDSLRHWTGRSLITPRLSGRDAARFVFDAPFALLSHDASKDPIFTYGNQTALNLFAMTWEELTSLPSRLSAEPGEQSDRDRLLKEVSAHGFTDNYRGIRIGRHGRRFLIDNVLVWNLVDPERGLYLGQAALFKDWKFL